MFSFWLFLLAVKDVVGEDLSNWSVYQTACTPNGGDEFRTCEFFFDLTYVYFDGSNPPGPLDGVSRGVLTINGNVPGPEIRVMRSDTIKVHVANNMENHAGGVSLHWHGMFQTRTPWMDGVAQISQCPITYPNTFTYEFRARPAGTFWYHSHVGIQYSDGLFGPMVIVEEEEPQQYLYDVNESDPRKTDKVMLITDWHHEMSETWYAKGSSSFVSPSVLVNGEGEFEFGGFLHRILVDSGTKIRLRLIGSLAFESYRISIDEHPLTIFGIDAFDINPISGIESVMLAPGQRFDIVLDCNKTAGSYYWIRARKWNQRNNLNNDPTEEETVAILSYGASTSIRPETDSDTCTANEPCHIFNCFLPNYAEEFDCTMPGNMTRLDARNEEQPPPAGNATLDDTYFLNFGFEGGSGPASVNGKSFKMPPVNPLTDFGPIKFGETVCNIGSQEDFCVNDNPQLCGDSEEQYDCACTQVLTLRNVNASVDLILINRKQNDIGDEPHPIHIHGHSFFLLGQFFGTPENTIDDDIQCSLPGCPDAHWIGCDIPDDVKEKLNYVNPPRMDTVMVPPAGFVVVRLRSTNPGWWIVHCHIDPHIVEGMGIVINELPDQDDELVAKYLPANFPRCFNMDNEERATFSDVTFKNAEGTSIELSPSFDRYVMAYEVSVTGKVSVATISASLSNTDDLISFNGFQLNLDEYDVGLKEGPNYVLLEVAHPNNLFTTRAYKITITRGEYDPAESNGQKHNLWFSLRAFGILVVLKIM